MIECKDADYVLAIAKYKTISAAAKSLFISQPALTKYLKSLEQRLGVILFDRNKKSSSRQWLELITSAMLLNS